MIRVRALRKVYRDGEDEHVVLDGLDLDVAPGELLAVVGASGSGKSTLLHVCGGLDAAFEGAATVDGQDLRALTPTSRAAFRNRTVGFVFQAANLLPGLTALENVCMPAFFRRGERLARADGLAALERVGLADKGGRRPGQLSGGERQRVALARALFARPRVLLADEPTGNLDAASGATVVALLRELAQRGLAVVVATHEERVASAAARVLRLEGGRLR